LFASEIESAYLGVSENKQRIQADLIALSQSVKNMEIESETTLVIQ
jgi:hypothetical protein